MFCAWTLNQELNASLDNVGVQEAEGNSSQFAFAQDNNLCDQAFVALFQKGFMTFSLVGTNSGADDLFLFRLDPFFPPSDEMGLEFGFGLGLGLGFRVSDLGLMARVRGLGLRSDPIP